MNPSKNSNGFGDSIYLFSLLTKMSPYLLTIIIIVLALIGVCVWMLIKSYDDENKNTFYISLGLFGVGLLAVGFLIGLWYLQNRQSSCSVSKELEINYD